ncbi:unnamed protein product [Rotaria socialis]|uniref:Uncharacterized protein n=1 Tax=Rotaria socialis TaxID=392032 RepID=A0A820GRU7_9BILA|nr:unnamed protein product [Rotaria socialis]
MVEGDEGSYFRSICTGRCGFDYGNNYFNYLVPNRYIQGGDVITHTPDDNRIFHPKKKEKNNVIHDKADFPEVFEIKDRPAGVMPYGGGIGIGGGSNDMIVEENRIIIKNIFNENVLGIKIFSKNKTNEIDLFPIANYLLKASSQFSTVTCYECTNCTDPFLSTSSSVSTTSSCNACYKMTVTIAYAPYIYVLRKCVAACIETSQTFGGGSVTSNCCAANLCNGSSTIKFSTPSCLLLLIFIVLNFIRSVF